MLITSHFSLYPQPLDTSKPIQYDPQMNLMCSCRTTNRSSGDRICCLVTGHAALKLSCWPRYSALRLVRCGLAARCRKFSGVDDDEDQLRCCDAACYLPSRQSDFSRHRARCFTHSRSYACCPCGIG